MPDSSPAPADDNPSPRSDAEASRSGDADGDSGSGYEPPRLQPLGTLPASTGMPASPQTFPDDPTR